jgi:hypothetical protein
VERAVQRSTGALEAAQPDSGPPLDALDRLIAAGWRELEHNSAIAQAAAEQLSPRPSPAATRPPTRGFSNSSNAAATRAVRTDLPTDWLVTATLVLMHACGDEVRAGRLDTASAPRILTTTIRDVLTGASRPTRAPDSRTRRSRTKS